jgi:hypothetical protein
MGETKRYIILDPSGSSINIVISHDSPTSACIGKIKGVIAPDSDISNISFVQQEEIIDSNEGAVLERCKERIRQLIGRKTQWFEIKGDERDKSYYTGRTIFRFQCRSNIGGAPGELGRFKRLKFYDGVQVGKDGKHLLWYDDSEAGVMVEKDDFYKHFIVRGRIDPMRKIRQCEIETDNATFELEVYSDVKRTEFIARFDGSSPADFATVAPGQSYSVMKPIKEEQYRESEEAKLIERCKERMMVLGGPIMNFIDFPSWESWERD